MLPGYLVWATVFNGTTPKLPYFGLGHRNPKFHFCQIWLSYISFYVIFNTVSMETFYLSHKLLIHHVIAFASGEEGL